MKATITPLAIRVYRFLYHVQEPLTARAIASKLNIYPHAVYRLAKILQNHGLMAMTRSYPRKFQVRPASKALSLFLCVQRDWFLRVFDLRDKNGIHISEQNRVMLNLSFIQSRDESIQKTTADLVSAESEVCLIISGAELPAETIRALKQAVDRKVPVRMLVQTRSQKSKEMFANWKKMGVKVRIMPSIEARIMLFDKRIVYLLSFSKEKGSENIGIRFDYAPAALVMREVFERKWEEAGILPHPL